MNEAWKILSQKAITQGGQSTKVQWQKQNLSTVNGHANAPNISQAVCLRKKNQEERRRLTTRWSKEQQQGEEEQQKRPLPKTTTTTTTTIITATNRPTNKEDNDAHRDAWSGSITAGSNLLQLPLVHHAACGMYRVQVWIPFRDVQTNRDKQRSSLSSTPIMNMSSSSMTCFKIALSTTHCEVLCPKWHKNCKTNGMQVPCMVHCLETMPTCLAYHHATARCKEKLASYHPGHSSSVNAHFKRC